MQRFRFSSQSGFSLVELSIVLAVIGVLAGGAISAALSNKESIKLFQTQQKMEVIEASLVGFLSLNKRFPCPAKNSGVVFAHSTAGAEDCLLDIGSVPTEALQLPKDYMIDGWGARFTYAISTELKTDINDPLSGAITLNDRSGTQRTATASLVLISHGSNKSGAWVKNGGIQYAASGDTDEAENSDGDTTFVADEPIGTERILFDDLVRYYSRPQLVEKAKARLAGPACTYAEDIIEESALTACGATPKDINCPFHLESFANQVALWCL